MGAFEARNGPVSIMTDLVYMTLDASEDATRVRSVLSDIGGTLSAAACAQLKMVIAEAALAYELANWGQAGPRSGTAFDLYGGGRFWWQTGELSLSLNAGLGIGDLELSGGRAIARSGDVIWFDPLVGLRLRHHVTPTTELVLRGDVGGFGAGSKISWQAMGTYQWDFARTPAAVWSGMLGYRALNVDFEKGAGNTLYQYDIL